MDSDLALAIPLVLAGTFLYLLFTAAELHTHEAPPTRERLDVAPRGQNQAEALALFIERRQRLLACLAWARISSLTLVVAGAIFLGTNRVRDGTGTLILSSSLAGLALAFLQSFVRRSVESRPEAWTVLARPAAALARLLFAYPVFVVEAPARLVARSGAAGSEASRTVKEAQHLLRLMEMEEEAGVIEPEGREMIRGIIGMVDTEVVEVMVPRTDLVAVDADTDFDTVMRLFVEKGKSRIPLYQGTVDHIIGVIYAKDLLRCLVEGRKPETLAEIAREPYFIPETKRVDELLAELRKHKVHFAVVVDEYGGTAGIATIEDLIEEIVGEIEDEYDVAETVIERISETQVNVDGRVPISELEDIFDAEIPHEDFDTVGGMVLAALGRVPASGEEVRAGDLQLRVLSFLGRRVKKVHVKYLPEEPGEQLLPESQPA